MDGSQPVICEDAIPLREDDLPVAGARPVPTRDPGTSTSRRLYAIIAQGVRRASSILQDGQARSSALLRPARTLLSRITPAGRAASVRLVSGRPELFARIIAQAERIAPDLVSRMRRQFPSLPWPADDEPPEAPERVVLNDFDELDPLQQEAVANNLALLWHRFAEDFGGVSGFLGAPKTQRAAYIVKLAAAAQRMESAKATAAGHHYVSVALMLHYVSCFENRSADQSAIALSNRVAALIDRGRRTKTHEDESRVSSQRQDSAQRQVSLRDSSPARTKTPGAHAPDSSPEEATLKGDIKEEPNNWASTLLPSGALP
jgi:hypothetical protein